MSKVIKSEKFILRKFLKSDTDTLAKNINNRKIYRNTSNIPYPYTLKHARQWLSGILKEYRRKRPRNFALAIILSGEVIGCVSLSKIKYSHKAVLGYWLAERYWGQGIMPKAVKRLSIIGFCEFKLKRIAATVFSYNRASMKVLIKNNFKQEGLLRKSVKKDGKYLDACLFAKVK